MTEEVKKLITDAKNVYLIPLENEPESLSAALSLFYTLKDLGKHVNLLAEHFPEKLNFLIPSLDFIGQPQNFVISIPRTTADVSQIYYEKNEDSLKIHLTINNGQLKKENLSFYAESAKPDLIITLGIQNFQTQLAGRLDAFGFLLDTPIINIDNQTENTKFGKINIIEQKSISEITLDIIRSLDEKLLTKDAANCILAGIVIHYEHLKNPETNSQTFQAISELIKKGADYHNIIKSL